MKNKFTKFVTAFLAVALALAAVPASPAFAEDENPPQPTNEKLEAAWARAVKTHERLGKAFEDTDGRIAKLQGMIDKAAANGKDVSQLQAALDAYEAALTAARPQYEALGNVIDAHSGFDANGRVTNAEQAKATLKEAGGKMKAIKESMGGTFKALREAIKAFREANKPAEEKSERD
ncbi:MAG: hypothetical protein KPEEDBHJ_01111 [Anaerolineales bacterium]|nr:hypothetical protein [Anaerolineales bacterium]